MNTGQTINCRVMLADDERSMRSTLIGFYVQSGCKVIAADDNGKSAFKTYLENRPDIVSLDLDMPGEMSGLDVLKRIREVDKDTYVVIVSGNTNPAVVREVISAGASNFIVKPFSLGRVESVINEFQSKRS